MSGKALMVLLTVMGLAFGLAGGTITATWSLEDRMDKKIDRLETRMQAEHKELKDLIINRW